MTFEGICQSPVIALRCKAYGALACGQSFGQIMQPLLLGRIRVEGRIDFADGVQHRFPCKLPALTGAQIGNIDQGIQCAEIQ